MAETDRELARRLGARDPEAFEKVYRRYGPAAYGLAFRIIGHPPMAEDVVHDAFAALWAAPEAFEPDRGTLRTFLLTLVHHRAVDVVRREERLRDRERRVNPDPVESEDVGEVVSEQADLVDRRREVREAVAGLPPEQRRALEMMYFEGYTQARIADATGVPLGTVKTRVLAAMRKLREALR